MHPRSQSSSFLFFAPETSSPGRKEKIVFSLADKKNECATRINEWMSGIFGHPVTAETQSICFANHVTKRNRGSENENASDVNHQYVARLDKNYHFNKILLLTYGNCSVLCCQLYCSSSDGIYCGIRVGCISGKRQLFLVQMIAYLAARTNKNKE